MLNFVGIVLFDCLKVFIYMICDYVFKRGLFWDMFRDNNIRCSIFYFNMRILNFLCKIVYFLNLYKMRIRFVG